MNKYNCDDHHLDIACMGCVKALVARHNKMLEFVKDLALGELCDDHLRVMGEGRMGLSDFQRGKNQKLSEIILIARALLKEIGKADER